jgi:geranylgeranyl pyrophosphate synthase
VRRSDAPGSAEANSEVARRVEVLLDGAGEALGAIARAVLGRDGHVLDRTPGPLWTLSVVSACVASGGEWRRALWPAAALDCAMAAADLFDDLADGEAEPLVCQYGAAGLLTLAGDAVLRVTEDGVEVGAAQRLGRMLGAHLAHAANGQISSLRGVGGGDEPVVAAYRLSALKSGPLGALAFGLGAVVAGASPPVVEAFHTFGWHVAVRGQIINDTRDAVPNPSSRKRDVLDGVASVPLVFANSRGAPAGLTGSALAEWEVAERLRVAAEGGIIVGELLAEADRRRAEQALDRLAELGCDASVLRRFVAIRAAPGPLLPRDA